nr:YncE family protein [Cedecea colo]
MVMFVTAGISARAMAMEPPPLPKESRFHLKTNYLQQAEEGIYELAYDSKHNKVFAAVMDRVHREDNKGYLYSFSPASLAIEKKYAAPYRAFSLAINPQADRIYVGHTQAASLRISMLDTVSGKVVKTSDRLSFNNPDAADPKAEHLRHMVYSPAANALFISYSNMLKSSDGHRTVQKLLVLDGTSLKSLGEVKDAYKTTAYGLAFDDNTQRIYIGGKEYINEIDAVTRKVLRTIPLTNASPAIPSVQSLSVDSASGRIFVVVFSHKDKTGKNDGLYIFDLHNGKQLAYVHTGKGANAVKYNPKYNEIYVTNFRSGTVSVVDAKTYSVKKEFNTPVYPNQMALSSDLDTLYVGIKEGFNKQWDADVFVEGAKEKILSISLNKS